MKPLIKALFTLLLVLGTLCFVWAQGAEVTLETLSSALTEGRYLDAYHAAFEITDSAPAELVEALSIQTVDETSRETRVFLLLFSARAAEALVETDSLAEGAFTRVAQAAAYEILGDVDRAGVILPLALEAALNDAQLYGLMAAAAFLNGNPEHLLEFSSLAIDLDPDIAGAYRLRGIGKLMTGDPEGALIDAERAVSLNPSIYFFHYMRVGIQFALGNPDAALEAANTGLSMNPHSFLGYAMRSNVNMAFGNLEQSARDFRSAVDLRSVELIDGEPLVPAESADVVMTFGRTFRFHVDVAAGQLLSFGAVSVIPGAVDPLLLLIGPDGTPLAFNDDGEDSLDAEITAFAIPADGEYTLVVSHANGGSEGAVKVILSIE